MTKPEDGIKIVAQNRRATHDYFVEDRFEAGIVLVGSEIKSIRAGQVQLREAYVRAEGREVLLLNAHIAAYDPAAGQNHPPLRPRKLLLHRRQINKLMGAIEREGMTVVPLKIYFNDKGRAKVEIALAKGKKLHDKRESEKKRDWTRERGRLLRQKD